MLSPYASRLSTPTRWALWAAIFAGIGLRILAIYYWTPLTATASDSLRHLEEARQLITSDASAFSFANLIEPYPYKLWLGPVVNLSDCDPTVMFFYATFMTIFMPLTWFLYMRNQFRDELYALVGFALFVLTPSFIGIYSFFQPETLLLPLIALSLWLNDSLIFKPGFKRAIITGLTWGVTIGTRLTALPLLVVSFCWTAHQLLKRCGRRQAIILILLQMVAITLAYISVPLKIYFDTGVFELAPGMITLNRILYESGADGVDANITYWGRDHQKIQEHVPIAPPIRSGVLYRNLLDDRYPRWNTARDGIQEISIDYTQPHPYSASSPLRWTKRFELWKENLFLLFNASSWPENDRRGYIFSLETYLTRLWLPLFTGVALASVLFRVVTLPTTLFWMVFAVMLFQQTSVVEGRYRKPLECVAMVAMLDIIRLKLPLRKLQKLLKGQV